MKFKPSHLGILVRPRIITKVSLVKAHPESSIEIDEFKKINIFEKSNKELFKDLKLGNLSDISKLESSYVCKITHFLIQVNGQFILINEHNIFETHQNIKKILGSRTQIKPVMIGVSFFKGLKKENNKLIPINPWKPNSQLSDEYLWFFKPKDIIPIIEIEKYESIKKGDLIFFQKTKGIVVKKKFLNKPKFWNTSSWSCYSVILLNNKVDSFYRFLPNRLFQVHKSSDLDVEDEH